MPRQSKKSQEAEETEEVEESKEELSQREVALKTVQNPQNSQNFKALLKDFAAQDPEKLLLQEGVRPLQHCENNCELLRLYDSASSEYYRENIPEFASLSMRYGHLLRTGATVPLGICRYNEDIRYGLMTLIDLEKDDFIGQYTGIIQVSDGGLWQEGRTGYSSDYAWDYPDFPEDWPEIEISAENAGNALRFANHSFEPNCRVEHTLLDGFWVLFFLAEQDIAAGTQLLVNYGEEYWANGMRELVHI